MRAIGWVVGVWLLAGQAFGQTAYGLDVAMPPVEYYSPVFLSAFQHSRTVETSEFGVVMTDSLDMIELYNETDEPISLTGWSIVALDSMGSVCQIELSGWILAESYGAAASAMLGLNDTTGNLRTYDECAQIGRTFTALELRSPTRIEERIGIASTGSYARKGLTKTYRSGIFSKDFATMSSLGRTTIYAGIWYEPPVETPVRIMELLPRSRECAPNELAPDCRDFIKLYNPAPVDVPLESLRLRLGYQGQPTSSSNTIVLGGLLRAGEYGILTARADGSPLSVTNDGGYAWLEDTYGIQRYDATIVSYPSAESVTKVGWAWAFDTQDDQWKWTSTAMPYSQASVFTLSVELEEEPKEPVLVPCAANQYRHPVTNRCRLIETETTGLKQCASNQYRNPATNRCRSVTASITQLTPCGVGQYRNPSTNRCRATAGTTTSSLKPCAANQERNPVTNRCRTVVRNIAADFPVEQVRQSGEAVMGWWALGGVSILAAGYAGWEWRRELMGVIAKVMTFVVSGR